MRRASLTLLLLSLTLAAWPPTAPAQSDPNTSAVTIAAEEIARLAAQDLTATPDASGYRALAVVPRGGNASEAVATALAEALRASGQGLAQWDRLQQICGNNGVTWATDDQLSVRQQAEIMGGISADGLILVRAQADPISATEIQMAAQMTLADPSELGFPWSFEAEATAQPSQRGSSSLWKDHPEWIIGAIVLLVVIWAIGAVRRRRA